MKLRSILVAAAALTGALAIVQGGVVAQAPAPQPAQGAPAQGAPPQGGRQGGRGQAAQPPQTGQSTALFDLTGTWVSVVNQDWYYRMITPTKGNYGGVPLNAAARTLADQFDPARYGGARYQTSGIVDCRAYGAPNVMRMPTRVRISWDSANVLKIETDWGQQTRLITFNPDRVYGDLPQDLLMDLVGTTRRPASMQGYSEAMWERPYQINSNIWTRGPAGRGGGLGTIRQGEQQPGGSMAVLTTNLSGGWLRRNGVPYGTRARVIEHYRTFQDPTGAQWFNVVIQVTDPEYLTRAFNTTADFRKEPDGSKWAPHPCAPIGG
jgi:hypothetical protein